MIFHIICLLLLIPDFQVSGCLKCHQDTERVLNGLRETLLTHVFLSRLETDFEKLHGHVTKSINDIADQYASQQLDNLGMSQIFQQLENLNKKISASMVAESHFVSIVENNLNDLRGNVSAIFSQFYSERFCPNIKGAKACGLMVQVLTSCQSCKSARIPCVGGHVQCKEVSQCPLCICNEEDNKCHDLQHFKSCTPCKGYKSCMTEVLNCGDRHTKIVEDGDLVLDCKVNWHAKVEGPIEYVFRKVEKTSTKILKITENSFLVIKGATSKHAGVYTCTAQSGSKVPFSTITYNVTVLPIPEQHVPQIEEHIPVYVNLEHGVVKTAQFAGAVSSALVLLFVIAILITNHQIKKLEKSIKDQQKALEGEEEV